jgi:transposase
LTVSGRKEAGELEEIRKKERILGLIQAQGQTSVGSIMVEMKMTREQVTNAILELVAMGLFTGYIDWKSLTFYSQDAKAVGSNRCPNCGGVREFVGKGVIKCPYCDVSLFIPPGAEQTSAAAKPPENWGGGSQ